MTDRPWMTKRDPELLRDAVEYALAFFWTPEGPMPEPDAELAERALSLIAGFYTARFGSLHSDLLSMQRWCIEHPGQYPETPSSRTN